MSLHAHTHTLTRKYVLGALAAIAFSSNAVADPRCPFVPPGQVERDAVLPELCEFLPRSPVFLDKDTITRCDMDQDGNGLDDEIEDQIAKCVTPIFRFDTDEPSDSLLAGEPVLGYSSWRIAAPGFGVRIRFRFVALFRRDGGFVNDDSVGCCCDAHEGDSQNFTIDVHAFKDGAWRVELSDVNFALSPPTTCTPPKVIGMRPVVYPSAGKHHWYSEPGVDKWDNRCTEHHRGNGEVRSPTTLFKVPWSIGLGGAAVFNTCAVVASGGTKFPPTTGLQGFKLDNLGFSGQTLFTKFYKADPIVPLLDGSFTPDADGDGLSEVSAWDEVENVISHAPTDPCVIDSTNPPDDDKDGLIGKCDTDPNFKQTYVGPGTPGQPAVPITSSWLHGFSSMEWGGFLDRDQDGSPDGVDQCPILKPAGSNTMGGLNRWGRGCQLATASREQQRAWLLPARVDLRPPAGRAVYVEASGSELQAVRSSGILQHGQRPACED